MIYYRYSDLVTRQNDVLERPFDCLSIFDCGQGWITTRPWYRGDRSDKNLFPSHGGREDLPLKNGTESGTRGSLKNLYYAKGFILIYICFLCNHHDRVRENLPYCLSQK